MPHLPDRRDGSSRVRDRCRSALPCIAGALRRSLLTSAARAASCSVRRLPGPFPRRRRSGSHHPPDLWVDARRVLVPFTARLFVNVRGVWPRASRGVKRGSQARTRRNESRAMPDSAGMPDPSSTAHTAGSSSHASTRSAASDGTIRTARAPGPAGAARLYPSFPEGSGQATRVDGVHRVRPPWPPGRGASASAAMPSTNATTSRSSS